MADIKAKTFHNNKNKLAQVRSCGFINLVLRVCIGN